MNYFNDLIQTISRTRKFKVIIVVNNTTQKVTEGQVQVGLWEILSDESRLSHLITSPSVT